MPHPSPLFTRLLAAGGGRSSLVWAQGVLLGLGMLASGLAWGAQPTAPAKPDAQTTLLCEVHYPPATETWDRTVTLTHTKRRLTGVAIDGVPVYTFRLNGRDVYTALDNERITLDLNRVRWRSDFRGLVQGEGACAWMGTAPATSGH